MTINEATNRKLAHQTVWFLEPTTRIISEGNLKNIYPDHAEIIGIKGYRGIVSRKYRQIYATKEELQRMLSTKKAQQKQKLHEEIRTKDDLIQYLYDNFVASDENTTNWYAKDLIRDLASEKFNLAL